MKKTLYMVCLACIAVVLLSSCAGFVVGLNQSIGNYTPQPDRAARYFAAHPYLSDDIKAAILRGEVILGMHGEDVEFLMGDPNETSNTTMAGAVLETWSYRVEGFGGPPSYTFVYFTNGVVSSVSRVNR